MNYRFFVVRCAWRYDLKGYVRNLIDGNVEVYAEGGEEELESLHQDLLKGPTMSRVDEVNTDELPFSGKYKDFEITY